MIYMDQKKKLEKNKHKTIIEDINIKMMLIHLIYLKCFLMEHHLIKMFILGEQLIIEIPVKIIRDKKIQETIDLINIQY